MTASLFALASGLVVAAAWGSVPHSADGGPAESGPLQGDTWEVAGPPQGAAQPSSDIETDATTVAQSVHGMARPGGALNTPRTYHIDPHLLADVPDANAVCGTADQVHDCGFAWLRPVCTDGNSADCVRGMCICTAAGGCDKPTCDLSDFDCHLKKPKPLAPCKQGCLTKPGTGWSCWHPCNMQHSIADYGAQASRIRAIRATGVCGDIGTPDEDAQSAGAADPALLRDIPHASGFCGSGDIVQTCGFTHLKDVCSGPNCYKGLCVCTKPGGCQQPTCKQYPSKCPMGLAQCRGGSCLAIPGTGWSCWHPCNLAHPVEDFGHQAGVAQAIRNSGNCTRIGVQVPRTLVPLATSIWAMSIGSPAGAASNQSAARAPRRDDKTSNLDAGIMLRSYSWPVFPLGESTANAGGSSRRRADKFHQPIHNSTDEVAEITARWSRILQGKGKMSNNYRHGIYGLAFVATVLLAVYLKSTRKQVDEPEAVTH